MSGLCSLVALALLASGVVGDPPARPDVLLVTIDAMRADRVGGHRIDTSGFDRVAAEGARFGLAMAPVPSAGPSAASLLSGRSPWAHGAWRNRVSMRQP